MRRLLLIAPSNSIHTARWVALIPREEWEIHLISSIDVDIVHKDMKNVHVHGCNETASRISSGGAGTIVHKIGTMKRGLINLVAKERTPRHALLAKVIKQLKPDLIHSLETQQAGYLTLAAKKLYPDLFPRWIHTLWGSDLYLFGKLKDHISDIRGVMSSCDCLIYECDRDLELAKSLGFVDREAYKVYGAGGFDIEECIRLRGPNPPSKRRLILLKGYQGWAGRALVGLRALERSVDILKDYQIKIFSVTDKDVEIAAIIASHETKLNIEVLPSNLTHQQMLELNGKARISIGLSISDGLPNSFLESMVMGAFPIQSNTSCANDWIENHKTGIIVPPNDPEIVESAIRKSIANNELVDAAAKMNFDLIRAKLDKVKIKESVRRIYNEQVNH